MQPAAGERRYTLRWPEGHTTKYVSSVLFEMSSVLS